LSGSRKNSSGQRGSTRLINGKTRQRTLYPFEKHLSRLGGGGVIIYGIFALELTCPSKFSAAIIIHEYSSILLKIPQSLFELMIPSESNDLDIV
jgi:hypothetical protein